MLYLFQSFIIGVCFGVFKLLENEEIIELKKQPPVAVGRGGKLKSQLDIANKNCGQGGYKWDEKEELYVNEDDGLTDSEDEEVVLTEKVDPEKPWIMTITRETRK